MNQRAARRPDGSVRQLSPRVLLWACVCLVLALLCATAASGYVLHRNYDRATSALNQHLEPAGDALSDLMATVSEQRIACLNPQHPPVADSRSAWDARSGTAVNRMSDLRERVGPYPRIEDSAGRLEAALRTWLGGARPSAGPGSSGPACVPAAAAITPRQTAPAPAPPPTAATPAAAAPATVPTPTSSPTTAVGVPGAGTAAETPLQALDARAADLRALLADAKDDARTASTESRGAIMLFAEVSSAVLLVTALGLGIGASRRVITPLQALEQGLHQAAVGTLEAPLPAPRGWPKRVASEMEGVYLRLREFQWASRRDNEALEQNGPSALGLRRILAAHGRPSPGVAAHGELVAAEGILAGDFFDTLALPDGSTVLVIGDVSGHGVQAGLLAVQLKCALLTALRLDPDLRTATRAAWSVLTDEDERFTTLVLLRVDPRDGSLQWLNAGHEEPFLRRRGGGIERLAATGPLVSSLIPDAPDTWEVRHTGFAPGDTVVLCTDGLTEARNADGVQLGEEAVAECLRQLPTTDPEQTVRALYRAAARHDTDWQRDDITVVAATVSEAFATSSGEDPETPEIR